MIDTEIIEASYSASLHFNLQDVNVEEVEDYWIKWGTLTLMMKDGTQVTLEPVSENEVDFKWPYMITEFDGDYVESISPIKDERIIIEEEDITEEEG